MIANFTPSEKPKQKQYWLGDLMGNYSDDRHMLVSISPTLSALLAEYAFLDVDVEGHA